MRLDAISSTQGGADGLHAQEKRGRSPTFWRKAKPKPPDTGDLIEYLRIGLRPAADRCTAVDRSAIAPANRRAALVIGTAFDRSTLHCADEPSPPARIEHIRSRSISVIGTAPHRARYSSAAFVR